MKKLNFLVVTVVLFSSCLTIKTSDLRPLNKNSSLLPALDPKPDIGSFESVFSIGKSVGFSSSLSRTTALNVSTLKRDARVQDVITIFDREVKDNITQQFGDKKGYIVCKIVSGNLRGGGYGWAILSGMTFLVPNLFGMPFYTYTTSLDVEVEIFDLSNKLIAKYDAQCSNKVKVTLYNGYDGFGEHSSAARISSINAFKGAMEDIKSKIEKDSNILIGLLNK